MFLSTFNYAAMFVFNTCLVKVAHFDNEFWCKTIGWDILNVLNVCGVIASLEITYFVHNLILNTTEISTFFSRCLHSSNQNKNPTLKCGGFYMFSCVYYGQL
jgi:hypothetical protein